MYTGLRRLCSMQPRLGRGAGKRVEEGEKVRSHRDHAELSTVVG
jgi:hypothetical protein